MRGFRAAAAVEQARRWVTLSDDDKERIGGQVVQATLPAVVQKIRSMCRDVLDIRDRPALSAGHEPAAQVPTPPLPARGTREEARGTAEEQELNPMDDPEWNPGSYGR